MPVWMVDSVFLGERLTQCFGVSLWMGLVSKGAHHGGFGCCPVYL